MVSANEYMNSDEVMDTRRTVGEAILSAASGTVERWVIWTLLSNPVRFAISQ